MGVNCELPLAVLEKFGDGPEPPERSNMHSKPGVGFVILRRKQLA